MTVGIGGAITGTGGFIIESGASVVINGDLDLSGTGSLTINGSLTVNGDVNINSGGSSICGTGDLTVNGGGTGWTSTNPCPGLNTWVLPIELLFFDAKPNDKVVDLNWVTASESNNAYFTIERSSNGIDFIEIGRTSGAGNSSTNLYYWLQDVDPLPGVSYYRLKQTDFDGNYTRSEVVVVNRNFLEGDLGIYPNPASPDDQVFFSFSGFGDEEVLVVVRDITGKEYYSKVIVTRDNQSLVAFDPEQTIPAGTYLVIATSNDKLFTRKLVFR